MAVSVIVSNFNGANYLPRLLATLKAQQGVAFEIIVVDRHSTDQSATILAEHPDVEVLPEPPESGLVAGYAVGADYARFDNLFFCNEDMWFEDDCLARLEKLLSSGLHIGAVMPLQKTYDGTSIVNAGAWFVRSSWAQANPYPFRGSAWRVPDRPVVLSGINAGACMISRVAYTSVSGWDTSFFLDYEDTDLSIRLWQRGFVAMIDPHAVVYHAVGASNARRLGASSVGKKRYVWAFSNQLAIIVKTFTPPLAILLPILLYLDRTLRDLLKCRWQHLLLDVSSAWVSVKRFPAWIAFRSRNRVINAERPGQNWFKNPAFDLKALDLDLDSI